MTDEGKHVSSLPFTTAKETLRIFVDSARASAVYGEPITYGESVLVPAAEVLSVMGVGFGVGSGNEEGKEEHESGDGGGGGGGGRSFARPVAVIIASPDGVRVEPIFDRTKIIMTAITAAGFMLAMVLRLIKPRQALRDMKQ